MLEQSLVFIFLIFLGVLLQKKVAGTGELKGLKVIILSVALPATIFIALLSIQLETTYLFLPLGALVFNLLLLLLTRYAAPLFGFQPDSPKHRTAMMLIPSLAPGLSCFPFLAEFMGEGGLALGALADVGNKLFVLILLYLLGIHWYHQINQQAGTGKGKLKSLFLTMLNEPINLVMIVALVMVAFGLNLNSLPEFLQDGIGRSSMIMTPLILLFIGLSVKIKWSEFRQLFFLLTGRSGMAFLLSALVLTFAPSIGASLALLIIVFPQSASSFWPYAHMSAINQMEGKQVFDTKMAISVLACSLPFSTLTILGIFSLQSIFLNPWYLMAIGGGLLLLSLLPWIIRRISVVRDSRSSQPEPGPYQYAD